MPEDPLEERLAAVERAVDDGDTAATAAADRLRDRVAAVEDDVAELEAAVQAVRGYVGGVRHVNDEVEQRADAAMAKAQAVERALAADGPTTDPDAAPGVEAGQEDDRLDGPGATARPESPDGGPTLAAEPATDGCPRCGRRRSPDGGDSEEAGRREGDRSERAGAPGDAPTPAAAGRDGRPAGRDAGGHGPGAAGTSADERQVGEGLVDERQVGEQQVGDSTGDAEQDPWRDPDGGTTGLLARIREVL